MYHRNVDPAEIYKKTNCSFCHTELDKNNTVMIDKLGSKFDGSMLHSMCLFKVIGLINEEEKEAKEIEAITEEMALGGASDDECDTFAGQRLQNVFGNGHLSTCLCSICAPDEFYDYYPKGYDDGGIAGTKYLTYYERDRAMGIPE